MSYGQPSPLRAVVPIEPREVKRTLAQLIFSEYVAGVPYAELARRRGMTAEGVRTILKWWLAELWNAHGKWKRAEMRCHALSFELRFLRAGMDCPADQPIEVLDPPPCWLKAFHAGGISTVNQLRAVDAELLLTRRIYRTRRRFPPGAIDWAILKLDRLGLSHVLKIPRRKVNSFDVKGLRRRQA